MDNNWHDIKDKSIYFPPSSYCILVCDSTKEEWENGRYSLISVEKLLEYIDTPRCFWTHWMKIPNINN